MAIHNYLSKCHEQSSTLKNLAIIHKLHLVNTIYINSNQYIEIIELLSQQSKFLNKKLYKMQYQIDLEIFLERYKTTGS